MNDEKQIILFDGVCNFCNFWVNFVIKRDKKNLFRFAALQSDKAKELTNKFNIDNSNLDTFVLIEGEKFFTKSTAALMVCKQLNWPIKILYPFIILPKFFRDFVYDLIARYRYKLFGKRDSCRVPTEEDKLKFLE
ncbi:MAG TPA: DCC1-like thiol-disulfide oxidoreductase family protein [Ignavibacteriaceae bacterium]|nr:DCC1-like thiol-disulfide oxidoreductase family protein [Ignavibacteriaceae bacterium]